MAKFIYLRGPPGSGKTTFARLLSGKFEAGKVETISSGNLIRENLDRSSTVNRGELADSGLVLRFMRERFARIRSEIVLIDGFPRQVDELIEWAKIAPLPQIVVSLVCDDEIIVQKLAKRRICNSCGAVYNLHSSNSMKAICPKIPGQCDHCEAGILVSREDDNVDAIRRRLMIYHKTEKDILNYVATNFPKTEILKADANGGIDSLRITCDSVTRKLGSYSPVGI